MEYEKNTKIYNIHLKNDSIRNVCFTNKLLQEATIRVVISNSK